MPFITGVALAALLFLAVFILIELIQKTTKMKPEISRKVVHLASALVTAALPRWLSFPQIAILSIIFILTLWISKRRNIFKSIHEVERKTAGEIWFPTGVLVSAVLFPSAIVFSASMLILGLADTAAELVGSKYGQHHYKSYCLSKTIEGSAAFFIVAVAVLLLSYGFSLTDLKALILVGLGVTVAEAISIQGLDNLFVPVSCGALLTLFF